MKDVTTPDGRVFYHLASIPYIRKDGSETQVAVWHSACVMCSKAFTVDTPLDFATSKAFGRKHCDAHKLTKEQTHAKWAESVRAAKAQKTAGSRK